MARTLGTLSPIDQSFCHIDSPRNPQIIASLSFFDRFPDERAVLYRFGVLAATFPELTCRLSLSPAPSWVKNESFDLSTTVEFHRFRTAPAPKDLLDFMSAQFSRGLDADHAPWRVVIAGSPEPSAAPAAAMLFMVHHAFADGLGGMELLEALCSDRFHRRDVSPPPPAAPSFSARAFARLAGDIVMRRRIACLRGHNSPRREIRLLNLELNELRRLKRTLGVSLNDLYLALVAGAVRRFVLSCDAAPRAIRAVMPVNTRPLSHRHTLGNHLTGVGVVLPLALPEAGMRLQQIRAATAALKTSRAPDAYALLARIGSLLPAPAQRRLYAFFARRTSFIATHFPDTTRERALGSARMLSNFGVPALMPDHGLAFCLITYGREACISVVSDPAVIADADGVVNFLREELAQLQAAVPC